jgi:hypothetical protein
MDHERSNRLEAEHGPEAVRRRLENRHGPGYLGDAVLGGIDGCVTTFAVVAGAVGAGFSGLVIDCPRQYPSSSRRTLPRNWR